MSFFLSDSFLTNSSIWSDSGWPSEGSEGSIFEDKIPDLMLQENDMESSDSKMRLSSDADDEDNKDEGPVKLPLQQLGCNTGQLQVCESLLSTCPWVLVSPACRCEFVQVADLYVGHPCIY